MPLKKFVYTAGAHCKATMWICAENWFICLLPLFWWLYSYIHLPPNWSPITEILYRHAHTCHMLAFTVSAPSLPVFILCFQQYVQHLSCLPNRKKKKKLDEANSLLYFMVHASHNKLSQLCSWVCMCCNDCMFTITTKPN